MKTKSFAMVAASVLLTASIAGVAPAMAEDSNMEMPMEQTLADNNNGAVMPSPADNGGPTQGLADNSQAGNPSEMGNIGALSSNSNSSNSSDEGTPDTATGDDDY